MIAQRQNSAYDRTGSGLFYHLEECAAMPKRSNRFFHAVPTALSVLAGVMFALLVGLVTLGQPMLSQYYQFRVFFPLETSAAGRTT